MSALIIASSALLIASASSHASGGLHGTSCPVHTLWALWGFLGFLVLGFLCLVPAFTVSDYRISTRWMYGFITCLVIALIFAAVGMVIDCV